MAEQCVFAQCFKFDERVYLFCELSILGLTALWLFKVFKIVHNIATQSRGTVYEFDETQTDDPLQLVEVKLEGTPIVFLWRRAKDLKKIAHANLQMHEDRDKNNGTKTRCCGEKEHKGGDDGGDCLHEVHVKARKKNYVDLLSFVEQYMTASDESQTHLHRDFTLGDYVEIKTVGCKNFHRAFLEFATIDLMIFLDVVMSGNIMGAGLIRWGTWMAGRNLHLKPTDATGLHAVLEPEFATQDLVDDLVFYFSWYRLAVGCVVLLTVLRLCVTLNFLPRFKVIIDAILDSKNDIAYFFYIFISLMVGFAAFMHCAGGNVFHEFHTAQRSLLSCMDILVESFDADKLRGAGVATVAGFGFFYLFSASMVWVLLNVFVAIMNAAYNVADKRQKGQTGFTWLTWKLWKLVPSRLDHFIGDLDTAIEEKFYCQALSIAFACLLEIYSAENDSRDTPDPSIHRKLDHLRGDLKSLSVRLSQLAQPQSPRGFQAAPIPRLFGSR